MKVAWRWPLADARNNQICFLLMFLGLGLLARDWSIGLDQAAIAIGACLATQLVMTIGLQAWQTRWGDRPAIPDLTQPTSVILPSSDSANPAERVELTANWRGWLATFNWRSPLITGLSLTLLLRVGHPATMVLAAVAAIASKFLIKYHDKHLFNPANFGIIAAFALTQDAWVSPGQWGEELWYVVLFIGAGGLVLKRVGRWDTTLTFLGSYALLEVGRNLWLGWTWDVWLHRMMSGSLLLFALFMITDPRSIPNARLGRILWALAIAVITFGLRNQFFLSSAMFWALFGISALTPLVDQLYPAARFTWTSWRSRSLEPMLQPARDRA